jgi:hypothetical protein
MIEDILSAVAFLVGWLILQRWVLPRSGVPS